MQEVPKVNGWVDYSDYRMHYIDGKISRLDGSAVEYANGRKEWWINGQLHREDGPAIDHSNGYKAWCINNKLHREDGPAIEYPNGYKAWYLNGKFIDCKDQEEFLRLFKMKAFW